MLGPAPIVGNKLLVNVDGVNRADNLNNATLKNADADASNQTYAEAMAGGSKDWTFEGTMRQSFEPGSLYRIALDNPGKRCQFRYAAHANAVASNEQPHLVGWLTLQVPDTIGTAASTDGTPGTVDYVWKIEGAPTLDIGTSQAPVVESTVEGSVAAGEIVTLKGALFNGTTDVKFGTTAAKFRVNSDSTIVTVVPTGVSGAQNITVKNADGTSSAFAYTVAS